MTFVLSNNLLPQETALSKETSSTKNKKFPKISEIDPDERKKKKESCEDVSLFHLLALEKSSSLFPTEKICGSIRNLEQLSAPISAKITLQKENGVTKTHFIIQTKTFGEVEIKITMYDTAPHSFHILLLGNERIRELSMLHQNMLTQQIQGKLSHITVHMGTPRLRKTDRFETGKKKGVVNSKQNSYIATKEGRKYDN